MIYTNIVYWFTCDIRAYIHIDTQLHNVVSAVYTHKSSYLNIVREIIKWSRRFVSYFMHEVYNLSVQIDIYICRSVPWFQIIFPDRHTLKFTLLSRTHDVIINILHIHTYMYIHISILSTNLSTYAIYYHKLD